MSAICFCSSCCNPDTCQFLANAKCDAGVCCENCQLRPKGTLCRNSANECDFIEYCSGDSPRVSEVFMLIFFLVLL